MHSLGAVGDGCPDLLVGYRGATHLLEVKEKSRKPSEKRLGLTQALWHAYWRGGQLVVVHSPEEALRAIGAIK